MEPTQRRRLGLSTTLITPQVIAPQVSVAKPALTRPDLPAIHYTAKLAPEPWDTLRGRIIGASVGIAGDLSALMDKIDPTGPGNGYPLSHRETWDTIFKVHGRVVLEPQNLSIGRVKGAPDITSLTAAYTDVVTKEVLGYVIRWFDVPGQACHRKYVMFQVNDPRTKGVGMQVAAQFEQFISRFDVQHTTIEAAYVGRLVWALEGFDFDSEAKRAEVKAKFGRFMERFDLSPADLYFRRDDGTHEPFSFESLHHTWDFAHVMWKLGTVDIPTRTSDAKDDKGTLDAGRAFLLGDFRNPELAECTCPDYTAQRPSNAESPEQRQAAAYAAARNAKQK